MQSCPDARATRSAADAARLGLLPLYNENLIAEARKKKNREARKNEYAFSFFLASQLIFQGIWRKPKKHIKHKKHGEHIKQKKH